MSNFQNLTNTELTQMVDQLYIQTLETRLQRIKNHARQLTFVDQKKIDQLMLELVQIDTTPLSLTPSDRKIYNEIYNSLSLAITPTAMFEEYLTQENLRPTNKEVGYYNYFVKIVNDAETPISKAQLLDAIQAYQDDIDLYKTWHRDLK